MKSLVESLLQFEEPQTTTESLFDTNLVQQELPYAKLLKSSITEMDIRHFCYGMVIGDFREIKNKYLKEWAQEFRKKIHKDGSATGKSCATFGLIDTSSVAESAIKESINYLKPGKIHKDEIYWNDAMYASSLDISWTFWGEKESWKNVTEWIIFIEDRHIKVPSSFVLLNRNTYDETDQAIIHKLIETASKNTK